MSARDHALAALDAIELPGWPAHALPPRAREPEPLSDQRDQHLAARLENGVLTHLLLLNHLIEQFSSRPLKKTDTLVRKVIGLGLYQILFLDRVGVHAAVNEAVNQARRFGKTSAAGFVNAILRRAAREPVPELPDATKNPREHARLALSHPPELFDRLAELLGNSDRAIAFCRHDNCPPPTILRLCRDVALESLAAPEDVRLVPHERPRMWVMQPTRNAVLREWSRKGLAQAQDPTSASVIDYVDAQPGQRVLDRCCGLGTKTLQLSAQVGQTGWVLAIDPSAARTLTLRTLLADRGIEHVQVVRAAWMPDLPIEVPAPFDRVLVDAPCSNSGVLARRAAARYAQDQKTLEQLRDLQLRILHDTARYVATDGLLVYSTCSVWPQENEQVVDDFLGERREFEQVRQAFTLPSFQTDDVTRYHDGGYVAVLRRTGPPA